MCFGFVSLEWGLRVASELLHQARQGCLEGGAAEVSLGLQMGVEDKQLALSLLGLVPSTVAWGDGTPFLLFEPFQHRSWVGQGFTGADPASPWRPVRCGASVRAEPLPSSPSLHRTRVLSCLDVGPPTPDRPGLSSGSGRPAARLSAVPTLPSGTRHCVPGKGLCLTLQVTQQEVE